MFCARSFAGCVGLLIASATAGAPGPIEIKVDCAAGDDLAKALDAIGVEADKPVIVHVAGTCSGPIEIAVDDLTLRGESPAAAAIMGLVSARGVRNVRLEKLQIAGGPAGVAVTDAEVTIDGCEISRTDVGVASDDSTIALTGTTIRDGRVGVLARRSRVDVGFGTIAGISDEAVSAGEFSEVVLFKTAVASDGIALASSTFVATLCDIEATIHARAYSRVSLAGSSGAIAALRGSISASNSEVFLLWLELGGIQLEDGARARISSAAVGGDIRADRFSAVVLSASSVAGELVCRRGSDAVCEASDVASVAGCPRCPGAGRQ